MTTGRSWPDGSSSLSNTRWFVRSSSRFQFNCALPVDLWRVRFAIWGLTALWVLDGPMTRAAFNLYVETQLAPTLDKGDAVILDNLSSHKSDCCTRLPQGEGRLIPAAGLQPRLEPIEMVSRSTEIG